MSNELTAPEPGDDGFAGSINSGRLIKGSFARWSDSNGWTDRDGLTLPSPMLVVAIDEALQRWEDNKPEIIRDKPLPNVEDLNAAIPVSEWETGIDGKPRPPWAHVVVVYLVEPWLDHVHTIYPDDATHIVHWLAHHRQQPGNKINHALVLGGSLGIGKDTLLDPIKHAVGPWNFYEILPTHMLEPFNSWVKSVILRINEGHDLGELDRFKFYDRTKIYTAAPPDVLRVNEKHLRQYYALNCLGMIITTNHLTDGLYLPPNDRRHYVAWSKLESKDFASDYWSKLWGFYADGGYEHVTAYLSELDLSNFDPKAPPPKTPAFWQIVCVGAAPEDADLADVLEALGNPDAITLEQLQAKATGPASEWLLDRRSRRTIPHRLERCGYTSVRNPYSKDGRWKVQGKNHVVYAKASLSLREQLAAAEGLR